MGTVLRAFDLHRKVPRDVTEATRVGGAITVAGVLLTAWLAWAQLSAFASTKLATSFHLDVADSTRPSPTVLTPSAAHNKLINMHPLLISFNITLPHVPCAFLALDVVDHRGVRRFDSRRNVFRMRVDSSGRSLGLYENPLIKEGSLIARRRAPAAQPPSPGAAPPYARGAPSPKGRHASQLKKGVGGPTARRLLSADPPAGAEPDGGAPAEEPPADGADDSAAAAVQRAIEAQRAAHAAAAEAGADAPPAEPAAAAAGDAEGAAPPDGAVGVDVDAAGDAQAADPPASPTTGGKPRADGGDGGAAAGGAAAAEAEGAGAAEAAGAAEGAGAAEAAAGSVGGAGAGAEPPEPVGEAELSGRVGLDDAVPVDTERPWAHLGVDEAKPVPPFGGYLSEFSEEVGRHEAVLVNFYAPWCYWSKQLEPVWDAVANRLAARAYGAAGPAAVPVAAMLKVDCTTKPGRAVCSGFAVHAYPSVRLYSRRSTESYEPYDEPRTVEALWRFVVAHANDVLGGALADAQGERAAVLRLHRPLIDAVSDMGVVLRLAEGGAYAHLDDPNQGGVRGELEEDVAQMREDRERLLGAVYGVAHSKGSASRDLPGAQRRAAETAEALKPPPRRSDEGGGAGGGALGRARYAGHGYDYLNQLMDIHGLLGDAAGRAPEEGAESAPDAVELESQRSAAAALELPRFLREAAEGRPAHAEGCVAFGSVEAARAPGRLQLSAHSSKHSFDFSALNVSHTLDHLAFGPPLGARAALLPPEVASHIAPLDGSVHIAGVPHLSLEHYVRVSATTVQLARTATRAPAVVHAHQFVGTTHAHRKEHVPAVIVSYEVSALHVQLTEERVPVSQLLLSLCAIVGGVVSIFGLLDGLVHASGRAIKRVAL